jgi:glutaredoxin-related protein
MNTNKFFLEQINDTENRKFPINYKFVEIMKISENLKNRKYINVDLYQTSKFEPTSYHKPISKLL